MIRGKKIIAIIPARAGSTSVKDKNIKRLNGKTLIEIAYKCLKKIKGIDKIILSTDSKKYVNISSKFGLEAPFLRPKKLSQKYSGDLEVLKHALKFCENKYQTKYDIILCVQPTCPLRKSSHIKKTIQELISKNYNGVYTVSETEPREHPYRQILIKNGVPKLLINSAKKIVARQQAPTFYNFNGACYSFKKSFLMKAKTKFAPNIKIVPIKEILINIDNQNDIDFLNYLLKKKRVSINN